MIKTKSQTLYDTLHINQGYGNRQVNNHTKYYIHIQSDPNTLTPASQRPP